MSNNNTFRRDLCRSSTANNLRGVRKYLERGCDPDEVDERTGLASLHYAANLGRYDIALELIEHGANIEIKSRENMMRPLHYAASGGSYDTTKLLLDRSAEVGAFDKYGQTALHNAAIKNAIDVARLLLERGAPVNAEDIDKSTPLQVAVKHKHVEMCRLLIEFGADTNIKDIYNMTPLHRAVDMDEPDLIDVILQARSTDLEIRSDFDNTALHKAAHSGSSVLVKALLDGGANIDAGDRDNKTAADIAKIYAKSNALEVLTATKELLQLSNCSPKATGDKKKLDNSINKLINKGASVNARDCLGHTALRNAVFHNNAGLVKILLKHGADCSMKIDEGTVLHLAAIRNNYNICRLICEHHAERSSLKERLEFINASDLQGKKALHIAANTGNVSMVRQLIECGAAFDTVDLKDQKHSDLASDDMKVQFELVRKTFGRVLTNETALVVENVRVYKHVRRARRDDGYTVFCWAVQNNKVDMVEGILDDKSADAETMTTDNGLTALHIACRNGNAAIVNKILDRKELRTLIDARTFDTKATALHMCLNVQVAQALISRKAIYCLKDANGMTPAESNRNEEIRKLLGSIDKAFKNKKLTDDALAAPKVFLKARNEHEQTLQQVLNSSRKFSVIAKPAITLNSYKNKFAKSIGYLFVSTCSF